MRRTVAWWLVALPALAMAAPPPHMPDELAGELRSVWASAEQQAKELDDAEDRAEVWGRLGMLYHAKHLTDLARVAYEAALDHSPQPRWHYLRGIVLAELGQVEASIEEFRATVAAEPKNTAAWNRLGTALLLVGDLDEARRAFAASRALAPDSALVLAGLADVAMARDDPAEALGLLQQAWRLEPEAGQLSYKLALVNRALGNEAEARAWLERNPGNRLAPTIADPVLLEVAQMNRSSRFYEVVADWAIARGHTNKALEALRSAVDLAPEDSRVGLKLALQFASAGALAEAAAQAEKLVKLDPESSSAWHVLAWALRTSSSAADLTRAADAAERATTLSGTDESRLLAAALAMRARRFSDARRHYQALAGAHPDQPYYRYWVGLAHMAEGDCRGRKALQHALRLQPAWGEAHLVLARADAVCGASAAAERRARELLLKKDDVDTRLTVAFAHLSAGELELAARIAREELPHADAALLLDAVESRVLPTIPFADGSEWWRPQETVQRRGDSVR